MASVSYWFLSPTVILALLGKLKGPNRTRPTPAFDWRFAIVDVVIPARDEAPTVALCLRSVFEQDFPVRRVIVVDDASSDATAAIVRRFAELSGKTIELIRRDRPAGKTAAVREQCRENDADALVVVDADTVLKDRNYISRLIEELFKGAGIASACGEVMPLTGGHRAALIRRDVLFSALEEQFGIRAASRGRWAAMLESFTVLYRTALYTFLQRFLYDGHLKLFGSRLNPIGCAVAYRTTRLRECFDFAAPRMGDNLSNSEDVFIGHFFAWKGYRNIQVSDAHCESVEPEVHRLPRQLFLWSSSFLQSQYYFRDLPLSLFRQARAGVAGLFGASRSGMPKDVAERRKIVEQYRWPWGEEHTRRYGRRFGLVHLCSILEKISYPLILLLLAIFYPQAALFTIALETLLCVAIVFSLADPGARFKLAAMQVAATPIRIFSLGMDLVAFGKYLADLAIGNRNWRK